MRWKVSDNLLTSKDLINIESFVTLIKPTNISFSGVKGRVIKDASKPADKAPAKPKRKYFNGVVVPCDNPFTHFSHFRWYG